MSVLASLQERIGRNSRNPFKPPSSDGQGYKTRIPRKGSGRKRGGQPGHPDSGPELLSVEHCESAHDHHPADPGGGDRTPLAPPALSPLLHQHLR
jgi:transposase